MARLISLFFPASNTQLLLSTTVAGGGATASIPLNNPYPFVFPDFERTVTLTSTDDLSGVNFTISGTDIFGNPISEVLVGPDDETVTSVNKYNTITNIASDGAYTNFSIGSGSTGTSIYVIVNTMNVDPAITLAVEVVGTIEYSVTQVIDTIEYYENAGPTFRYVYPASAILLGADPIATTDTSGTVVVTIPSTAGLVTGDIVTIAGAADTNAITAIELNIRASITVLSDTTFSYETAGTADATSSGGGDAVTYTFPPLPVSFPVVAAMTGATTNQIYNQTSPTTAFQISITSSDPGGSLTFNILQQGLI